MTPEARYSYGAKFEEDISDYLTRQGIANTLTPRYDPVDILIDNTNLALEVKKRDYELEDLPNVFFPVAKLNKYYWGEKDVLLILSYYDVTLLLRVKDLDNLVFPTAASQRTAAYEVPIRLFDVVTPEELTSKIQSLIV